MKCLAYRTGVVMRAVCIPLSPVVRRADIPSPWLPIAATSATTTILRWVMRSALYNDWFMIASLTLVLLPRWSRLIGGRFIRRLVNVGEGGLFPSPDHKRVIFLDRSG